MGSEKFKLDLSDVKGLGWNALLVGGAAAVTYILQNFGTIDLGAMGTLLVPIIAVALDSVVKWLKNNTKKDEE
jgi:hypothetical protein